MSLAHALLITLPLFLTSCLAEGKGLVTVDIHVPSNDPDEGTFTLVYLDSSGAPLTVLDAPLGRQEPVELEAGEVEIRVDGSWRDTSGDYHDNCSGSPTFELSEGQAKPKYVECYPQPWPLSATPALR